MAARLELRDRDQGEMPIRRLEAYGVFDRHEALGSTVDAADDALGERARIRS